MPSQDRGDRTARVIHRIERGVIYPRNGYAVGYVDNVQFEFKNGAVLFNDRIVGEYVQKGGRGRIGQKPIQIAYGRLPDPDPCLLSSPTPASFHLTRKPPNCKFQVCDS